MDSKAEVVAPIDRTALGALFREDAIYGLILVSGMIVISGTASEDSWRPLTTVSVTLVVFWAAHVYARALAHYAHGDHEHNLLAAVGSAAWESKGMILVAIPALLLLLLGRLDVVDDEFAIIGALVVDVLLLGFVGWIAVSRWSESTWARIGGAVMTALFGVVLIVAKAFIH